MAGNVMKALKQVPAKTTQLVPGDLTWSANTTGEVSKIAEYQAKVPLALIPNRTLPVRVVAYESFTTDGTASNTETFDLSYNLVDNDKIANDLVLYEGNNAVSADSVSYSGDSFDYTDDGTANTLHVYYVTDEQAELEVKKVAPQNFEETMVHTDAGLSNVRDQYADPLTFEPDYDLHGVVPVDWKVAVFLKAPYSFQRADETDTDAEATNLALDLPIRKAGRNIEGLEQAVKDAIRG